MSMAFIYTLYKILCIKYYICPPQWTDCDILLKNGEEIKYKVLAIPGRIGKERVKKDSIEFNG